MCAIELRRNVNGQLTSAQRFSRVIGIRSRGKKVSAQREKDFSFSFVHRLDRIDRIVTVTTWRLEIEFFRQGIQKRGFWVFPYTDGSISLHIRMSPHRAKP